MGGAIVAVGDSTKDDEILTQAASPPSSHIVVSPPATKYDVFLSFRGEDTRRTFASYLYQGLCNAGIHTFMDYELRKGEDISQVLLRKIEESEISMIIFSENYASSTWCLDELVHILECKEKLGRVVIPIFYNIDPSNIRKQDGRFGNGFDELKQRFKDNPKKLQSWRSALFKSASFSGWNSNCTRSDFELIEEIVDDTLGKLNNKLSPHLEGLVGISHHIENVCKLLCEARIVGIWGMGGAGKTTLAEAIFKVLRDQGRDQFQFDAFSFVENVKEKLKKMSLNELQHNFLIELLGGKVISIYDIKSTCVKKRLGRKNILLILDDIDDATIVEGLTEVLSWCGEGSRIIITSRDKQVLQNAHANTKPRSTLAIYHVLDLDFHDAIHLFSLKAFKQHEPFEGYMELSKSVVEYCHGNPLALVVVGCSLCGREKEEWESFLEKLDKDPPKGVVDALKLSFDGLDEKQQNMFLDLAFLVNERVDISLNQIRQLYGRSGYVEIRVLEEKSLISFNNHCPIVMHDLVKKMGLKIARNQPISDARTPIRLWRHEDIANLFNRGKGIEAIRCLSLDVSRMKNTPLGASIFRKIRNLIFLKIYKSDWRKPWMLNIRGVLDYLSEELRFLSWEECPLSYVPLHFCAENLVKLYMPNSNFRQPWNGNQHFPNLEEIDLSHSKHLTALPDLSDAPKIKHLNLEGCVNLSAIHSSTFPGEGVNLNIEDCGPMQIKLGGSIKGRSSRIVSGALNPEEFSFHIVTMKVFECGNMICGATLKHEAIAMEDIEELTEEAQSLGSLLPFVKWGLFECFEDPFEFGHDFNEHHDYSSDYRDFSDVDKEERGDRGEMMNEHQVVTMLLMEDDQEDDVLMEDDEEDDCCSKSVTFTRAPNSITRWSLLTKLTSKSLPLFNECRRRIKPCLDLTLSFPGNILPSDLSWPYLSIYYNMDGIPEQHRGLMELSPYSLDVRVVTGGMHKSAYAYNYIDAMISYAIRRDSNRFIGS